MNLLEKIEATIRDLLCAALTKAFPEANMPDYLVEVPKDKTNGDYSTNLAMLLARPLRRPPREIAELIAQNVSENDLVSKVDVAGGGFINFYLSSSYLYGTLKEIEEKNEKYGYINVGDGKKVNVEYVSANPTGPMHMGNARGGAVGDCLASILETAGFSVVREFYVNDAGAQIEKFGRSLDARYCEILTGTRDFPEDGYHGDDIKAHAEDYIGKYGDSLLSLDEETRKQTLVDYALPMNLLRMKEDLSNYRISYDKWFHESVLYEDNEVMETVELLKKTDLVYESGGALWFKSTKFLEKKSDDDRSHKDDVLVRANGIPTYFAADIAYHRNKFLKREFDIAINVWGADHHGHIARMKGAMEALGIDPDRLHVITIQLVRLMENGDIVRMSKRTGKMITLSDLLSEIGVDAARFYFNMRHASSHFDFDLGLAKEQSGDNPVYYVQYAHARICSILRLLAEEGLSVPHFCEINPSLLTTPQEIELLKVLADFPEQIRVCAVNLEPSRITRYIMDVAAHFHSFYSACRIKGEPEPLALARLKLCDSVRIVISNALKILGIVPPEKM